MAGEFRVLIVDDAPFIREVLQTLLSEEGFEIVGEACDGVEAVEKAESLQPNVILMDMVMPNLSGIQATKQILKKRPDTRIIACTTLDQEVMIMKAMEAGCVDYVCKPFDKETLVRSIRGGQGG